MRPSFRFGGGGIRGSVSRDDLRLIILYFAYCCDIRILTVAYQIFWGNPVYRDPVKRQYFSLKTLAPVILSYSNCESHSRTSYDLCFCECPCRTQVLLWVPLKDALWPCPTVSAPAGRPLTCASVNALQDPWPVILWRPCRTSYDLCSVISSARNPKSCATLSACEASSLWPPLLRVTPCNLCFRECPCKIPPPVFCAHVCAPEAWRAKRPVSGTRLEYS